MTKKLSNTAYIALGSNQGDRCATIIRSLDMLDESENIATAMVSQLIETEAVGGPADQPPFLNGAAELRTSLSAQELLGIMLDIEHKLGRQRREKWGQRTIDLDLLLFEQQVIDLPQLKLPHPLMHKRLFVLAPLVEIAPNIIHPTLNRTIKQIHDTLAQCQ